MSGCIVELKNECSTRPEADVIGKWSGWLRLKVVGDVFSFLCIHMNNALQNVNRISLALLYFYFTHKLFF